MHINLEHGGHFSFYFLPYPLSLRGQESGVSAWKEVLFLSLPILAVMVPFIACSSLHPLLFSFCINVGQLK